MDRYVVREPRAGTDYPQGNQMIAFSPSTGSNNMIQSEAAYFAGYGSAELPMPVQRMRVGSSGLMGVTHVNPPLFGQSNIHPGGQGQVMSGIDPGYLAAYADNNAAHIAGQQRQQIHKEPNPVPVRTLAFSSDYQNRSFAGADRYKNKTFPPQVLSGSSGAASTRTDNLLNTNFNARESNFNIQVNRHEVQHKLSTTPVKQSTVEVDAVKIDAQNPAKTRADQLKALQKGGPRAFSGPVEKVLKWHRALQDIGVLVVYEIVAKCVSVRQGEGCAKNLVVRDDSGPAMQLVYYEIDFLLPELKPPCTIRVVGRMMPGTSRLQAFHVRRATGDDVATLPRRAAVGAHHVAKLCKEFGLNLP